MKVLHIATSDITGGAARAAYRLHKGLHLTGADSTMLVEKKYSKDISVVKYKAKTGTYSRIQRLLRVQKIRYDFNKYKWSRPAGLEMFSDARTKYDTPFYDYFDDVDVLNLHWIAGFIDYQQFFRNIPPHIRIVWTLHDMNPFTGGCHYAGSCTRYFEQCGVCEQLGSAKENDLSQSNRYLKDIVMEPAIYKRLQIVTPSQWLSKQAKKSSLFRGVPVKTIQYGVDTSVFLPRDTGVFRETIGIPENALIIGFVADSTSNKRKGLEYLKNALEIVDINNIYLLSVGKDTPDISKEYNHVHLGNIELDSILSLAYSLFDVYVCSSIEDNLPNTVIESLACGTPVVGFNIGGMPDMVIPGQTGLLAKDVDAVSLANCLYEILSNKHDLDYMSKKCREKAMHDYTLTLQAERYSDLYNELCI